MSERLETKRCIKALYKYSSFPFSFPFPGWIEPSTLHVVSVGLVCAHISSLIQWLFRFSAERCNCIAEIGYCHDMLFVCRLPVTRFYYDKTTENIITRFSL